MRHGHSGIITGNIWVDSAIFLGLIGFVIFLMILAYRRSQASDGLTPVERKNLDYPEDEILSMIRQHGGPIPQNEILESLPGETDELAGTIKSMEEKGLITRVWQEDLSTYAVSA